MKTSIFIGLLLLLALGVSGQTFYDHYSNGQKSQRKSNWEEAVQNYHKAIQLKKDDEKRVRTYGVNFIDYFPNRELGIAYYRLKDFKNARLYLEQSLNSQYSERAHEYLAKLGPEDLSAEDDEIPEIPADAVAAIPLDRSKPSISVLSPSLLSADELSPVPNENKQLTLTGKVEDQSGIYEVLVNGKDATLSASGEFQVNVPLSVGSNNIVIVARDIHQNSELKEFTIVRKDKEFIRNDLLTDGGKYYALIIGVSEYEDPQITDLDGLPVDDASILARILEERYTFDQENISLLKNPSRGSILRYFDWLSRTATKKDNVLIFYAGHGFYDEKTELGYWLPADAEAEYTANWIYNDVLVANLKRIQSKHTLLVSDACFGGSIFKTRALNQDAPSAFKKKYDLPSRKAITSGVLKTVPNKSVFFKYFAEGLEANMEIYMSASQLFQSIEIPVANNSPNTPQYGDIQNVGDEGGDFIFIRR